MLFVRWLAIYEYYCIVLFSLSRCYTLRLLLYFCDIVKLHVAFFSVLPFMVNKDEYYDEDQNHQLAL